MVGAPILANALRGKRVVMVGGSGFVGRHVAQALLGAGARLRVAARHPERGFRLRALGDTGQLELARCDITRPETLGPVLAGADAVVNLVGAFDGDLEAVQGAGAGRLAAQAQAAGAKAFVHVSAIGADAGSSVAYARTKASGEAAVRAAFPGATLLRPAVIFGPDDAFLNMFGALMAAPVLPVFVPQGRLQPVYVGDVAAAVLAAVAAPAAHGGQIFELAGPEVLTMLELNQRIAAACRRTPLLLPMPDPATRLFAALPFTPISQAQVTLLQAGSVANPALPGLAELGVRAHSLGLFLGRWMARFAPQGRFATPQTKRC